MENVLGTVASITIEQTKELVCFLQDDQQQGIVQVFLVVYIPITPLRAKENSMSLRNGLIRLPLRQLRR